MEHRGVTTFAFAACLAGLLITVIFRGSLVAETLEDTFYIPLDHPAIRYGQQPGDDPVARLEKKLENGQAKLEYDTNGWGYLPSILKELGINVDSQVLVFSKGSIQSEHIDPSTPRAIYFDDDVSVGYVQHGDELEVSGLDPKEGVYFYTMEAAKSDRPQFTRRADCLRCHQGPITLGVPGLLVSSIQPSTVGRESHGSSYATDDRVSLDLRWGGWYVTGTTGSQTDLGNNTNLVDPLHPGGPMTEGTQNVTSLAGFFDTSKYLARTSDLVALMTIEHQTRMTNLLTRIGWDTRIALRDHARDGKLEDAAKQRIDSEIQLLTSYMLFADEATLEAPVAGVSTFTKTFAERGPRDKQGRSLRDFDLHTRLFKYPLSYMIYSAAFDALPDFARDRIYQRLYNVLSGKDQSKAFSALSTEDRKAVLDIVRETKTNLPVYWNAPSVP